MAQNIIPRCGLPACTGCPVSVLCLKISIRLKQPTRKLRAPGTLPGSASSRLTTAGELTPYRCMSPGFFPTLSGIAVPAAPQSFALIDPKLENSPGCVSAACVPAGHGQYTIDMTGCNLILCGTGWRDVSS
jgi:hypothetical protein